MGATEKSILAQCKNTGEPIPERILNKPQLATGLDLFLEAFYELSADRQTGMGVGKIPFTAIQSYANEYGFIGEQREDLFYFVRAIDNKIVDVINRKNKPSGEKPVRSGESS